MARHLPTCLWATLTLILAWPSGAHTLLRKEPPFWIENFQKGMRLAREKRLPVIIFCDLKSTRASHILWNQLRNDPEIVRLLSGFVRIRLDQPDGGVSLGVYAVNSYPALIVQDAHERELGRVVFPQDDDQWMTDLAHLCALAQESVDPPEEPCGPRCHCASDH